MSRPGVGERRHRARSRLSARSGAYAAHRARPLARVGPWSPCSRACPGGVPAGRSPFRSSGWRSRRSWPSTSPAWPDSGWRSSSSRPSIPAGGLPVGGSTALAGRLWLLAQGGELELRSGPLVLAPLLLTLAIAWGLSRAGRGVARARGLTGPWAGCARRRRAGRGASADQPPARARCSTRPTGGIGLAPDGGGRGGARAGVRRLGCARESGLLDAALDRLPGAPRPLLRGVLAGLLTAMALCTAVVAVALVSDAQGYAALSGSLGGAGAGAVGLLGLGAAAAAQRGRRRAGPRGRPGLLRRPGTLVSVHGVTLGAVPALPLLAALPDTQAVPLLAFASQAVPALAGLVAGATVGRWFTAADGGSVVAGAGRASWPACCSGWSSGALVWVAGGSLGDGALAEVGRARRWPPASRSPRRAGIAAALAAAVTRWRRPADRAPVGAGSRPARVAACPQPSRPRGPGSSSCSPAPARCARRCSPRPTTRPTRAEVVVVGSDRAGRRPGARPPPRRPDLRLRAWPTTPTAPPGTGALADRLAAPPSRTWSSPPAS